MSGGNAAAQGVRWRLGTMGFGYDDWAGVFYPRALRAADRLASYATCFDVVELDTTFHATPDPKVVRRWAEATPPHFRFTAKLPRQVTHAAAEGVPLISRASLEATRHFLDVTAELGEKRRAILMQFPPAFTADHADDLAGYLDAWPSDVPAAVELRHDSWWRPGVGPRTARLLRARNMPWVAADEAPEQLVPFPPDDETAAGAYRPRPLVLTADWLYLRWIGRHEQYPDLAEERVDPARRLGWWAANLRKLAAGGRVREVVGFFNNGYSGHSPTACRTMLRLLDLPVPQVPARQASLF